MNPNPSTTSRPITFKGESVARDYLAKRETILAIKHLRDSNPYLGLKDAKDIVESWKDGGAAISVQDLLIAQLAYNLAVEYYRGKLSGLNLDYSVSNAMAVAAARENGENLYGGTAAEMLETIMQAVGGAEE